MRLEYTPEQEQLAGELRRYFADLMTPELREALHTGGDYGDGRAYRDVVRRLGRDGWLTLGWPEEYGGHGPPMLAHPIFTDDSAGGGGPGPFLTLHNLR